jgi:hypothetical protein
MLTMTNLSEALFASLLLHRRRKDDEVRRNDLFEVLRDAQKRQTKRS